MRVAVGSFPTASAIIKTLMKNHEWTRMDTNVFCGPQNTLITQIASQTSASMLEILYGHDMMDC